ncbi:ubiquitin thioesterase otu1-like [Nannochloropsis oceanica]
MPLTLKINGPEGKSVVLKGLDDGLTLQQLKDKVQETFGVPGVEQKLRASFPPKDVVMQDETALVTALGIQSGSAITVVREAANESASVAAAAVTITSAVRQLMDMGFPAAVAAKALEMAHNDVGGALELCIGGVVTEESLGSAPAPPPSVPVSTHGGMSTANRVMIRRVVDADNSCLFNAIGYCMEKDRKLGTKLRRIIADCVRNRPDVYTEATLGKTPKEYSDWIQDPTQWGGEIELFVLSQYYGCEIVAVEIKSVHAYVYGEGKNYSRRIYVLYDGVHYDALAMAAGSPTAPESLDMTQFPAGDEGTKDAALAVAAQLKQERQFVDMAGFTLRCLTCMKGLSGQEEAKAHAAATRHQNFGEY